jgi:hypothetical protein
MGEPSTTPYGGREHRTDSYLTVEVQRTVSSRISLNRYQESMILKYLVSEVLAKGFLGEENFYFIFYLLERLTRGGTIRQIRDSRERHVCLYAYTVLKYFPSFSRKGSDEIEDLRNFLLTFEGPVSFDSRVLGAISRWEPRRYLKVETEPLERLIERSGISQRYSSYCKGYGEGSPALRKRKTKFSAELDGETEDRPNPFDGNGQSFVIQLIQILDKMGKEVPGISIL